ncbi:MAG: hypothetical protein QOD66_1690 [Solirubrobacteraceae bacterium]|nr:hypothetical protein [Solirubrobacteraceae bacterium]
MATSEDEGWTERRSPKGSNGTALDPTASELNPDRWVAY